VARRSASVSRRAWGTDGFEHLDEGMNANRGAWRGRTGRALTSMAPTSLPHHIGGSVDAFGEAADGNDNSAAADSLRRTSGLLLRDAMLKGRAIVDQPHVDSLKTGLDGTEDGGVFGVLRVSKISQVQLAWSAPRLLCRVHDHASGI